MILSTKCDWLPFLFSAILISFAMDYLQILWVGIFVFLVPILWFRDAISSGINLPQFFSRMFVFSLVFTLLSSRLFVSAYPLDWLKIYDPVLGWGIILVAWALFSMVMSLPIGLWVFLTDRLKSGNLFTDALVGASAWVIFEYVRSWLVAMSMYGDEVLFGPHHTYYSLAYTVSGVPIIRELLPVGGMYLTSFVIILINYLCYAGMSFFRRTERERRRTVALAMLIGGIVVSSYCIMVVMRREANPLPSFTASVMNTRFPSIADKSVQEEKRRFALEVIEHIENPRGVIILPENFNVLPPYSDDEVRWGKAMERVALVIGSFSGERFYDMFFFNARSEEVHFYRKELLMPLGEYSVDWIYFLIRLTRNEEWLTTYDAISSFHTAKKGGAQSPYEEKSIEGLIIGGSLCSENISPYIYRDATRFGATVLVNIGSLSPFHGSPLLSRQTLAIDTARALENGRYFITAANSGASFVITDKGDIEDISDSQGMSSFFNSEIKMKNYATPYVKYGDYMLPIAFSVVTLTFIWREKRFRKKRR